MMRRIVIATVAVAAVFAVAATALAQATNTFDVPWFSIAGGGETSSANGFTLNGTIGQAAVGDKQTGGAFTLTGGFQTGISFRVDVGVCGDLNDDGNVDVFDTIIILHIIVGNIAPTSSQLILGDVDRDGDITVFDAIFVLQHIVGAVEITECGSPAA